MGQELAAGGRMGLTLAARSCSLLKVDPQVLHRHPVIGVLAALATPIREGLKDRPISPPHCRHRCLDTRPLFSVRGGRATRFPALGKKRPGWGVQLQSTGVLSFRLAIPGDPICADSSQDFRFTYGIQEGRGAGKNASRSSSRATHASGHSGCSRRIPALASSRANKLISNARRTRCSPDIAR